MTPWIGQEERDAVGLYLSSGGWLTEFALTEQLERELASFVGTQYASMVPNGTLSLYVALKALAIESGDEVIVPDYTMIATANAVVMAGATPVFVDVDPSTQCLDLEAAERAITSETKALMVVSINGRSPDMDEVGRMAARHGLRVIEDAAQSLGSRSNGRHLGSFGEVGSFSFSPLKIITTGQGGAVVTDDEELYLAVERLKDFGRATSGTDHHETMGFNFKFTDVQAAIGLAQMQKLPWRVERKKEMFRRYRAELEPIPSVTVPVTNLSDTAPWFIDIMVPDPAALASFLAGKGIGTRRFYPPTHTQPAYNVAGTWPGSQHLYEHGLWLPSSSSLTDEDIATICGEIRSFFSQPR